MFGLSAWEIGLIVVLGIIVIGPGNVPRMAKSVARAVGDLKRTAQG